MCEQSLPISVLETLPAVQPGLTGQLLEGELSRERFKVIVLDDDPTGVQTVHGIHVYTDWSEKSIAEGFAEENRMFFILTNSRGMTQEETCAVHRDIAGRVLDASQQSGRPFVLIGRSDSTLRGHYPAETETLCGEIERQGGLRFDGEILCPFFCEGGRFTLGNVHYVREGDMLVPAAMTEFAKDRTFGYAHSHLGRWCEEKTAGAYRAEEMTYIPLEMLRAADADAVAGLLMGVTGFQKVVVNAAAYEDVMVFLAGYLRAARNGKRFLFRTAAAVPKLLGGVSDRPLLSRSELVPDGITTGGIIIVGSHVQKTTDQLNALMRQMPDLVNLAFDVTRALESGGLEEEAARVSALADNAVRAGKTALVFTSRRRLDLEGVDKERQLLVSVRISDAVTSVVSSLTARPAFIVAKGGITSSDVGVKALGVRRALVMGQAAPGIPVWKTDAGSKFPDMPYVIFPGNVGGVETLYEVVRLLR